jgi:tetratricopeptide (TPR) repeat protein
MTRLTEHAAIRKWQSEPYVFLTIEAQIVAGEYRPALEQIRASRKANAEWDQRYEGLFESLRAVAAFGTGQNDEGRAALGSFLAHENLRAENLIAVANRLVAFDEVEQATQVLARALKINPYNQAALTRLVELDIVLNRGAGLAEHVQQLLKTRRPSADLLRSAQFKLGSDLFLFSREVPRALQAVAVELDRDKGRKTGAPQR